MEKVPSNSEESKLPPWVMDVRNSYSIMRSIGDEGPAILGVGSYENQGGAEKYEAGKIGCEKIFDLRQALFDFLDKCEKAKLPEAIPLEKGYHGPEITVDVPYKYGKEVGSAPFNLERKRPSVYFLPRSIERYSIAESFENHPEVYPDSPDFIGFEKLKRKEANVSVSSGMAAGFMGEGVGFDSVRPTTSRDNFIEKKFGEITEALEEDEIEIILRNLREEIKNNEMLKFLDELESKIVGIRKIKEEKIISERSRISNDIQRRAKNLVAVLKETGAVAIPKEIKIGGNIVDGFFKFLPEENRLMKSGMREPVEFYQARLAEFKRRKDEKIVLPSGKTITYQDFIPDAEKDIEKTKLTEADEEDWVVWGTRIASVLADLLPEKIREVVTKWPLY